MQAGGPRPETDSVATSNDVLGILDEIQRRVLWLATRMIDHANHDRVHSATPTGREAEFALKVGGHQASSASMVSIMTALWFAHIGAADKVAVKPHAAPVFHAIKYLQGELDRSWLTTLREFGGLQSYPSRTKDPDVADFSTGSVGLGVVAPLFSAMVRRYIEAHGTDAPHARFIALVGDAELDEGNVWEAITDAALQGLGNVMWVVDTNRQSLDRVIPDQKIKKLMEFFDGSGWHVVEAKYGRLLHDAFARDGGDALRRYIDEMPNERYQSLFALRGSDLRPAFLDGADQGVRRAVADVDDDQLGALVQNLGGHDLGVLLDAYRSCDAEADRPSVVFAYTVKGWGLPIAGDPLNHAALLSSAQIDELRHEFGLSDHTEFDRFTAGSAAAAVCETAGDEVNNSVLMPRPRVVVPEETSPALGHSAISTQEVFGRIMTALGNTNGLGERIVTMSPDVSVSTNLGGWINRFGVFHHEEQPDWIGDDRLLRWRQGPDGRHVELGISEMNLFLALGAFGLSHEHHGHHLIPVGTVYDPFVCRGLDGLIYALYNGSRFVLVGTPSGTSLAPEGGAHQSTITASIGMELPGLVFAEPCYATALDWWLCDAIDAVSRDGGESTYLRLSTRPVDQSPFDMIRERMGDDALRTHVLEGGYRLIEPDWSDGAVPRVILAGCGAVMPELVNAAGLLSDEGVAATVIDLVSPDRVHRDWVGRYRNAAATAQRPRLAESVAARLIRPEERSAPIVTVHDAAAHALSWVGSIFGQRTISVGVDEFGQSGDLVDVYRHAGFLPEQIVNAALVAIS